MDWLSEKDPEALREAYFPHLRDAKRMEMLRGELAVSATENAPRLWGYWAATLALKARFTINPFEQFQAIQEAQKEFERALKAAPDEPELRFLRLSVEYNTPVFLGLSAHVQEDTAFLCKWLKNQGTKKLGLKLAALIAQFLQEKRNVQEKEILNFARLETYPK